MFTKGTFKTAFAVAIILAGARWVVNAVPGLAFLRGVV